MRSSEQISAVASPRIAGYAAGGRASVNGRRRIVSVGFYLFWSGRRCVGRVSDLSPSGMQLVTREEVTDGTVMKVDAACFQAVGRAAYIRRVRAGNAIDLEFVTARFLGRTGSLVSFFS